MTPVYTWKTFFLTHKHIQNVGINFFSKILVTHKTIRAKQVALGIYYKSYTVSLKICYLEFGLEKFLFPHSDADLQAIISHRKQDGA